MPGKEQTKDQSERCGYCDEPILADASEREAEDPERAIYTSPFAMEPGDERWHYACVLYGMMNHVAGTCACHDPASTVDRPIGMTRRQAAYLATCAVRDAARPGAN